MVYMLPFITVLLRHVRAANYCN